MSLAASLNELAAAHAQSLINDDEYRILRQNLFEQHAADPATPTPRPPHSQPPQPQGPPLRRKQSVVANVASLFRRATGRSSKKPQEPPPQQAQDPHPQTPRRPHRKPSLLSILHQPQHTQSQSHSYTQSPSQDQEDPAALRAAIASTEAEHTRLLDAFVALESSTLKRIQYRTARRLYTPTPTNVSVLIEGREWRRHTKPVPSIILPPPMNTNSRHHSSSSSATATTNTSDQLSIYSAASSSKISLSRSFSTTPRISSLSQPPPHSPRYRSSGTLQRQNSVSSASTQSTGTSSRLAAGHRSMRNLSSLAEGASMDTLSDTRIIVEDPDDTDTDNDDPEAADYESAMHELDEIRRRREEVHARFLSKLEYLRAKLRSAEIRERVMRR
ncbi:hypothetical protein P691DRAFT_775504 [Macrolepiota fuliginosa MF-IS2]|uniref:Uncharacterized protein n=1 Tax=Macrolepiota fuliginosa MF-IS2 TaxID=1400762 RepID=A0A9P5XF23_9AGAR|nr:hypothetical protein P691DRAFT_775504 [Macrolepiota fuliginosa MF-IS2]